MASNPPWWTLPAQAYAYQGPQTPASLGVLGRIHDMIDPVKALGGYGGVIGAVMMGPGLKPQGILGDAADEAGAASAPLKNLVVARRMPNGRILRGQPGQIHADLYPGMVDNEIADQDLGYALLPSGRFMSRTEAMKYINKVAPQASDIYDPENSGKLDAYWLNK